MRLILSTFLLFFTLLTGLQGQSIHSLNEPFVQGQAMLFAYAGGTGSPLDWVGIYKHNQVPGNVSSTVWQYISTESGNVEFPGNLPPGYYDVHLFCCDGYTILASYTNFYISPIKIKSRLDYYKATDPIRLQVFDVIPGDSVMIYLASDVIKGMILPGAVPVTKLAVDNINNQQEAIMTVTSLPSPGQYVGMLMRGTLKRGYDGFEIKDTAILPQAIHRIGLGSCGGQGEPQPALTNILEHHPDFFLYLGDNLYIDTYDASVMQATYESFIRGRPEFQLLRASVPVLATWDDHDYGCCDEDADYPIKQQSQQIFLDFFEEPALSPRRTQEGIYTSYTIGEEDQRLQVILLDTRYFLDDKRPNNGCGKNDYCPWAAPSDTFRTMLGEAQWAWLREKLLEPADLRLIATSVQFSSSYHGFESWRLFPYQLRRFLQLIKETHAEHLFFVSGDMHYSEVSKIDNEPGLYPIYDFTASSINSSWPPESNLNREGNNVYGDPSVSLVEIDWFQQALTFKTFDVNNTLRFSHTVPFGRMEFASTATDESPGGRPRLFRQDSSAGPGSLHLVFTRKARGSVILYDMIGRKVRESLILDSTELTVPDLPQGVFLARFHGSGVSEALLVAIK